MKLRESFIYVEYVKAMILEEKELKTARPVYSFVYSSFCRAIYLLLYSEHSYMSSDFPLLVRFLKQVTEQA